jgi:hypothetical protein
VLPLSHIPIAINVSFDGGLAAEKKKKTKRKTK